MLHACYEEPGLRFSVRNLAQKNDKGCIDTWQTKKTLKVELDKELNELNLIPIEQKATMQTILMDSESYHQGMGWKRGLKQAE